MVSQDENKPKRKGTTIKSRKARGRHLQNWVRERLIGILGILGGDIRCAIMGEGGADIKLTLVGLRIFPYKVECKNQEGFTNVYRAYEQAQDHNSVAEEEPLVILKMNRRRPLAVVDCEHFIRLHKGHRKNV